MSVKRFAKAYVEITNVCNLTCAFCKGTDRKKQFMSVTDFELYAKKLLPYTDFLYLHVLGEPLLHPKLSEILGVCERLGLKVIITTNGTLLSVSGSVLLSYDCVFKVSVSLHSFAPDGAHGTIDGYLKACFDFCETAARRGIISVLRLWNGGAGEESFNSYVISALKARFPDGEWADNTRGIRIDKKLFLEYGERFNWREEKKTDRVRCFALKDQIGVLCDGTVVPCCIDCDGALALGNLKTDGVDAILSSDEAKKLLCGFESGKAAFEYCKACGFAKNKFKM